MYNTKKKDTYVRQCTRGVCMIWSDFVFAFFSLLGQDEIFNISYGYVRHAPVCVILLLVSIHTTVLRCVVIVGMVVFCLLCSLI